MSVKRNGGWLSTRGISTSLDLKNLFLSSSHFQQPRDQHSCCPWILDSYFQSFLRDHGAQVGSRENIESRGERKEATNEADERSLLCFLMKRLLILECSNQFLFWLPWVKYTEMWLDEWACWNGSSIPRQSPRIITLLDRGQLRYSENWKPILNGPARMGHWCGATAERLAFALIFNHSHSILMGRELRR
jgi:hypothetical protein